MINSGFRVVIGNLNKAVKPGLLYMDDGTNDLVCEFYLGDESAWETLILALRHRVIRILQRMFKQLSEDEHCDLVDEFFGEFYVKARAGRSEVTTRLRDLSHGLTAEEIDVLKIESCKKATGYKPSSGHSLLNWSVQGVRWRCLTLLKTKKRFRPVEGESETPESFPESLPEQLFHPSEQGELKDLLEVKELLKEAMEGDELIYLEVWFVHGPDPPAWRVKEAIARDRETGETVSDPYVTNLKQSFLVRSFLVLIERIDKLNSLANLVQRLMRIDRIDGKMHVVMMENIWNAFLKDEKIVRHSKTEISPEDWANWETLELRNNVQETILVDAYQHFRVLNPQRRFCYLVELYADTRFGTKVRQLFMEGGRKK